MKCIDCNEPAVVLYKGSSMCRFCLKMETRTARRKETKTEAKKEPKKKKKQGGAIGFFQGMSEGASEFLQ